MSGLTEAEELELLELEAEEVSQAKPETTVAPSHEAKGLLRRGLETASRWLDRLGPAPIRATAGAIQKDQPILPAVLQAVKEPESAPTGAEVAAGFGASTQPETTAIQPLSPMDVFEQATIARSQGLPPDLEKMVTSSHAERLGGLIDFALPTPLDLAFGAGKYARGAGKLLEHGATRMGSGITGKSVEALKTASTGSGRQALHTAAAGEGDLARALVEAADNPAKFMPEGKRVTEALGKAQAIDIRPTLAAFDEAMPPLRGPMEASTPGQLGVREKLQAYKTALQGKADKGYLIPAADFKKLREALDQDIDFNAPDYASIKGALKKPRDQMRQALVEAAGPEYAEDMAAWAKKIDAFEELNHRLGKVPSNRLNRAETILRSPQKEGNQDLIAAIDEITGGSFSPQSKTARLASEFTRKASTGDPIDPEKVGLPLFFEGGGPWRALYSPAMFTKVANPAARILPPAIQLALEAAAVTERAGRNSEDNLPPYLRRP